MALVFRPLAVADLQEIRDYIAEDNPTAAEHLIASLKALCRKLDANPMIGRSRPELHADLRSLPLGSYLVFYRVLDDKCVEIVRVLHGARDLRELL